MNCIIAETTHEAYAQALQAVYRYPEHEVAPRGMRTLEVLNAIIEVSDPTFEAIRTASEERNTAIADYYEKEMKAYVECKQTVQDFEQCSKFWGKIANDDGTINSAYGWLLWRNRSCGVTVTRHEVLDTPHGDVVSYKSDYTMMTPWDWAKQSLINDLHSRQAFARINLPSHQVVGTKDQPCTMHLHFMVRDMKMNLTAVMRSNDVVRGLVYDMPFFIYCQHRMAKEISVVRGVDIGVGTYYHFAHSLHMYTADESKVKAMLGLTGSKAV